ncbi:RNA polymerase II mediator complex subunit [Extremus antarcticus]|uniref:Mediator of RNA polymerase II transcription subunit 17 n=1 Tax=Extremus antarcticus TaxID=702011 RepID=A0AAJ0DHF3_9PEZI|nr:RNA polymerase II mediator complex subunit [Extremus antarcticus]
MLDKDDTCGTRDEAALAFKLVYSFVLRATRASRLTSTCCERYSRVTRMAPAIADSFSIQPWARTGAEEGALKDILARANFERGHFRDISEASLQEELVTDGALELSESEEDEEEDEDEGEGPVESEQARRKPTTREELYKAKYEMLGEVKAAEQDILMALDFVSLLVSKDAPKQGATSISPFLKNAVPMGSLGIDLWQRMPADKTRDAQDELLATKDNVRKETEYWNQVLSISEEGWNVCRLPGQQNRLAVRFGFSESSPEFSRRGIAALIPKPDGSIALERGIGSKPQSLRVVLRKGSRVVGTSRLPEAPDDEDTALAARIRYARDSLYDEELYHEMVRESRTLASLGVHMTGSAIHLDTQSHLDDGLDISLDLVTLNEGPELQFDLSSSDDRLAQATLLAARLLLSQAHRARLKKRSEVPPPLSDKRTDSRPLLPILRPLLSFVMHQRATERLNSYLDEVARTLRAAKLEVDIQSAGFSLSEDAQSSNADSLISTLMRTWTSKAQLEVHGIGLGATLTFSAETELANNNSFSSNITLSTTKGAGVHRFDNFQELVRAADAKLASRLAEQLLALADDDWMFEANEALLTKDTAVGQKSESVWVTMKSGSETLSLRTLKKTFVWTLNAQCAEESFRNAAVELLTAKEG